MGLKSCVKGRVSVEDGKESQSHKSFVGISFSFTWGESGFRERRDYWLPFVKGG